MRLGAALACALLAPGCANLRPAAGNAGPQSPSITLEVQAAPTLKALLEQHLDLARLTALADSESLDASEWARLIATAPAQARELLQTEGYFDAVVRSSRLPGKPARVVVSVDAGPQVRVSELTIAVQGSLDQAASRGDMAARATLERLRNANPLQPKDAFRSESWAQAKAQVLAGLRAAGYAAATLARTEAQVDTASNQARLIIVADSGPHFRSGPLRIEGLRRHDDRTVRDLAGFAPGTALTEMLLLDYQDALQKSGLFEAVTVGFDTDPAVADAAQVRVHLRELPLQQATAGLGVSGQTGARASLEHKHRRPFGWGVTSAGKVEWGVQRQTLGLDIQTHPGPGFSRWLAGLQAERVIGDSDTVLSQRVRLGRTQDTPRYERLVFAELLASRKSSRAEVELAQALSVHAHLTWRALDSLLLPTQGLSLALQTAAGFAQSREDASGGFGRIHARLSGYWPLGRQWYGQARVEAGQVLKRDAVTVPDALGFRAGGDESVRGYALRSLSPQVNGSQVSGLVVFTASAELARPLSTALPQVWGAVFVDAGRAENRWADLKPAWGAGLGVRWRSPVGPLRADLAWGQETRKLRLHLTAGVSF